LAYLVSGLAYVATATVLLLNGWGLLGLLMATFVREFLARNYCRQVYLRCVPKQPHVRVKPNIATIKKLWPNASKLGVLSIGTFLLSNGNVLICSQFLSDTATASFGLTVQIGAFLTNFSNLWLGVKWPTITMLRTQGRQTEMSVLFARRLALTLLSYVCLALLVTCIGNWLLELKGTHTRLLAKPYLVLYFLYLAQQLVYVNFGSLAYTENVVPFFMVGIFTGIGMFVLSFILTWAFGLWGMLLAPLIAESLCSNWYTVRRGFRGQPLSVKQLLNAAFRGTI
jgi:O-antigen/teichoic acid export membrane protein